MLTEEIKKIASSSPKANKQVYALYSQLNKSTIGQLLQVGHAKTFEEFADMFAEKTHCLTWEMCEASDATHTITLLTEFVDCMNHKTERGYEHAIFSATQGDCFEIRLIYEK